MSDDLISRVEAGVPATAGETAILLYDLVHRIRELEARVIEALNLRRLPSQRPDAEDLVVARVLLRDAMGGLGPFADIERRAIYPSDTDSSKMPVQIDFIRRAASLHARIEEHLNRTSNG